MAGSGGELPGRRPTSIPVLYRDPHLLAVAKPSGLVVHRGWARDGVVLMDLAREVAGRRVYPLHRLDRGTSGAVLFAFESELVTRFQAQLHDGGADKRYLALVRGHPPASGTVDHPVPKTRKSKERRPAVTDYRSLAVAGRYALVEARPRTGRLHQIRRHMKHRSWPILGDVHYGKGEHNRLLRERHGLARLALHAFEIQVDHPATGERLTIRAPLPRDLADPLRSLGLEPGLDGVLEELSVEVEVEVGEGASEGAVGAVED
ncbi:MAG: pseudouridine synthase [Acidobacteriota bacterium]